MNIRTSESNMNIVILDFYTSLVVNIDCYTSKILKSDTFIKGNFINFSLIYQKLDDVWQDIKTFKRANVF